MRPISLAVSAFFLLLASAAVAQETPYPATAPAISSVQVTAPQRAVRVHQEDLDAVRGVYGLSNGWRMKVDTTTNGITARIDKRAPIRLVAMSPDKYVSRDGNVEMEFNRGATGDDMIMSYVPDSRVAQVIVVKATLAGR
jgi:hypothetical protein